MWLHSESTEHGGHLWPGAYLLKNPVKLATALVRFGEESIWALKKEKKNAIQPEPQTHNLATRGSTIYSNRISPLTCGTPDYPQ